MQQSIESGFDELVKELVQQQHKIYIGTSAGLIVAGQKSPDYLLDPEETNATANQKGYGFVNFTVLPHWGSEDFRELYVQGRMEIAYQPDQVPLVILTDTQYVHVQGDQFEIIDVRQV
mgnify:CR=1 FL=1